MRDQTLKTKKMPEFPPACWDQRKAGPTPQRPTKRVNIHRDAHVQAFLFDLWLPDMSGKRVKTKIGQSSLSEPSLRWLQLILQDFDPTHKIEGGPDSQTSPTANSHSSQSSQTASHPAKCPQSRRHWFSTKVCKNGVLSQKSQSFLSKLCNCPKKPKRPNVLQAMELWVQPRSQPRSP